MGMHGDEARRQYLAAKLAAHAATDAERDEAIGTILLSLWGKDDVEAMIDERHKELCKECPARIAAEGNGSFKERVILQLVKFVGWAFVILAALAGVVKYLEAAK